MTFFVKPDCSEGIEVSTETRNLVYLGAIYCEFLKKYFNRSSRFPVHSRHPAYESQLTQLRKLVGIVQELGVDPEQYMKAQFELLSPWIKKNKKGYLIFNMMTSEKAQGRYQEWLDRLDKQNELKKDKILAQYAQPMKENIRPVIFRSIQNFYKIIDWYLVRGDLNNFHPLHLLEIAHKAGDVDSMYIYINPMVNADCENEYLQKIWKTQDKELSKKYKDWLQRLFEETRPVVAEKGVEAYV